MVRIHHDPPLPRCDPAQAGFVLSAVGDGRPAASGRRVAVEQLLQHVVAVAVQLALADARDAPQLVEVIGGGLRDGPQRGVVEDDVRGDVLLARRRGAPLAQGIEAQLRVGGRVSISAPIAQVLSDS